MQHAGNGVSAGGGFYATSSHDSVYNLSNGIHAGDLCRICSGLLRHALTLHIVLRILQFLWICRVMQAQQLTKVHLVRRTSLKLAALMRRHPHRCRLSSAPITSPAPSTESSLPKTFQDQKPAGDTLPSSRDNNTSSPDSKSSSDPDPGLSPRPDTRLNSSPGPQLVDPDNRTTSLPVRQAIYLVKRPAPPATACSRSRQAAAGENRRIKRL